MDNNNSDVQAVPTDEEDSFKPLFTVKVPDVSKDGLRLRFRLLVKHTSSSSDGNSSPEMENVMVRLRDYTDFEFLAHQIRQEVNRSGVIYPPLPLGPLTDPRAAERQSREIYGADSRQVKGDDHQTLCSALEDYLAYVSSHPRLGASKSLAIFLEQNEPPARPNKIPSGSGSGAALVKMLSSLTSKSSKEEDTISVSKRTDAMKSVCKNFSHVCTAQLRLAGGIGRLVGDLHAGGAYNTAEDKTLEKTALLLLLRFAEALEDQARILDVTSEASRATLGSILESNHRQLDATLDALHRREALAAAYEDATRTVEKSKPGTKRMMMQEAQAEAEMSYQNCCAELRLEMADSESRRVSALQKAISKYVEMQLCAARDQRALLTTALNTLRRINVDAAD